MQQCPKTSSREAQTVLEMLLAIGHSLWSNMSLSDSDIANCCCAYELQLPYPCCVLCRFRTPCRINFQPLQLVFLQMAEDSSMPQWKGLFDWSMSYHDGTKPTDFSSIDLDPQKIKWCADVSECNAGKILDTLPFP